MLRLSLRERATLPPAALTRMSIRPQARVDLVARQTNRVALEHVGDERHRVAAGVSDLVGFRRGEVVPAAEHGDSRAGRGKACRDGAAQYTVSAGDERRLSREIERVVAHRARSLHEGSCRTKTTGLPAEWRARCVTEVTRVLCLRASDDREPCSVYSTHARDVRRSTPVLDGALVPLLRRPRRRNGSVRRYGSSDDVGDDEATSTRSSAITICWPPRRWRVGRVIRCARASR
jgi:hypothetical protein